uniref:Band 7 domain-containing protein n=1 Tax=Picea sitchensis TaxID=3332 RepID=D5AAW8_PICSI|nr:unknown [Picea sitchensis]
MTSTNGDTLKNAPVADTEFNMDSDGHNSPARQNVAGAPKQGGIITVQPLRRSEMQPSYAQNLGLQDVNHGFYGTFINCIGGCAGSLGQFPCCPFPNPFKQVKQGSVGLVSRFGQFYQSVDPGLVKINPCSESLRIVDVKIQLITVPQQRVTTKDNVSLELDSVIYWHVSNPYRAAFGIQDVKSSLVERAQTTLRDVVGSRTLQSVISDRTEVARQVEEIVEGVAEKWGVSIESILIKDIVFSRELQESLSSAATQRRIGESKVIAARAEVDAARLMRQAADILASPAAMQIRQLESLQAMAKTSGSKVIFVPMNLTDSGSSNKQFSQSSSATAADSSNAASGSGMSLTEMGQIQNMSQM